jgi:hypothetical protein
LWALSLVTVVAVFVAVTLAVPTADPPELVLPAGPVDPVTVALPAICDTTSLPTTMPFTVSPLGAQFVYAVSSQQNSRPLVIRPGGWVMQPFVATTPYITGMSVVPSVSPGRSENLAYEIVRPVDNAVVWQSGAVVDDTNKDGPVPGDMPRALPVEVGTVYLMRVANLSTAGDVSIYFHRPDDGDAVPYYRTACQRPSSTAAPQSAPHGMVLSGAIHGRDAP